MADSDTVVVIIPKQDNPMFGRIYLSQNKNIPQYYRADNFEKNKYDTEDTTTALNDYVRNLKKFGHCPQIPNCMFLIFDDNYTKIMVETSFATLETLKDTFFESEADLYGLSKKGKNILRQLLFGYKYLEDNNIFFSKGNLPNNILFLKGDKDHIYPRIVNFNQDGFDVDSNNYKKLRGLIRSLLGRERRSNFELSSFLTSTTQYYNCALNHPVLWKQASPYLFAIQACSFLKENKQMESVKNLYKETGSWKKNMGADLLDYYNLDKTKVRNPTVKKNPIYVNGEVGLLLFKRDTFVHHNQNMPSSNEWKSTKQIEEWFRKDFPWLNSKMYDIMRNVGFCYVDNQTVCEGGSVLLPTI